MPVILPFMCVAVPALRDEQRARAALAVLTDALADDELAAQPLASLQRAMSRYTAASHTALAWLARIADETSINKRNRN